MDIELVKIVVTPSGETCLSYKTNLNPSLDYKAIYEVIKSYTNIIMKDIVEKHQGSASILLNIDFENDEVLFDVLMKKDTDVIVKSAELCCDKFYGNRIKRRIKIRYLHSLQPEEISVSSSDFEEFLKFVKENVNYNL